MSPSSSRSLSWGVLSASSRASSSAVTSAAVTSTSWLKTGPPTVLVSCRKDRGYRLPFARPLAFGLPDRLLPDHLSDGHLRLSRGLLLLAAEAQQAALGGTILPVRGGSGRIAARGTSSRGSRSGTRAAGRWLGPRRGRPRAPVARCGPGATGSGPRGAGRRP